MIGVVSGRCMPEIALSMPAEGAGEAAGRGAGSWSRDWAGAGLEVLAASGRAGGQGGAGVALIGIAMLALTPVVAASGAVYGLVAAEEAELVREAQTTLDDFIAELRMQETFRDQIVRKAQNATKYQFVPLYPGMAEQGIATILEVAVESFGLDGPWGVDPPLTMVMRTRAKLFRVKDGVVLTEGTFLYESEVYQFTEWAANDAQLFREALDSGYQTLAREIVEELFVLYRFPSTSPWVVDDGATSNDKAFE